MKSGLKIVVTLLFTLIYGVTQAQIIFFENSYDFGTIAEDGGTVEHYFRFRNASAEPTVIISVRSSCGCTKAEFSHKPIMPDSVSAIKVTFNPMNYPGKFARKVVIATNKGVLEEQLLVTGVVTPRKKSIEEEYPIVMAEGVRVAANAHSFGYIEHGKVAQSTFELMNTSSRRVKLSIDNPYPELEFYYPAVVAAGERAVVNFTCLLPENSTIYGSLEYSVNLLINGQKGAYPFIINGLAIDSRVENANNCSQMIALSENFIKFGAVKCAHAKHARMIEVRNDGNKPLEIRKIELSSEGFNASLEGNSTIAPNDKRTIEVELNPAQLPYGAVVKRLRIVSNDPKVPVLTIRVSAIVEE